MQNMTSTVCNSVDKGTIGRLKDIRDGKTYSVARLNDGLCWMTQNLALDLSKDRALTSNDSDVSSNWTPKLDTIIHGTKLTTTNWPVTDIGQSYNPGDYIYTKPAKINECKTSVGLSECISTGWVKVEMDKYTGAIVPNSTWTRIDDPYFVDSTQYVGTDGQSICFKELGSPFGDFNHPQCMIYYSDSPNFLEHYLAGNYYTYGTATVGSNSGNSICPRGWKLPARSGIGSYSGLLSSIKVSEAVSSPYYFVLAGNIYNGEMHAASVGEYLASSVSNDATYAALMITSTINPSASGYRHNYGASVRCVAR